MMLLEQLWQVWYDPKPSRDPWITSVSGCSREQEDVYFAASKRTAKFWSTLVEQYEMPRQTAQGGYGTSNNKKVRVDRNTLRRGSMQISPARAASDYRLSYM